MSHIKLKSLLERQPANAGLPCPNCGANMAFCHGKCPKCEAYCGCSDNPTSDSDWCDDHRKLRFAKKPLPAWLDDVPGVKKNEAEENIGLTKAEKEHLAVAVKMLEKISARRGETRGSEPAKLAISNIQGLFRWNSNLFEGIVVEGNMSRADFELIARVIKSLPPQLSRAQLAIAFAAELKKTNPLFDSPRFIRATGVSADFKESKINEVAVTVDSKKITELAHRILELAKKIKAVDKDTIHLSPYKEWADGIIMLSRQLVFESKMNEALSADELRILKSIANIAKKIRDNREGPYRVWADHIITICNATIKTHTK